MIIGGDGGNNGAAARKPALEVKIIVFDDGQMAVNGFPPEYGQAMGVMATAQRTVMDFFMAKAVAGEFQEQRIIRPRPGQPIPKPN